MKELKLIHFNVSLWDIARLSATSSRQTHLKSSVSAQKYSLKIVNQSSVAAECVHRFFLSRLIYLEN